MNATALIMQALPSSADLESWLTDVEAAPVPVKKTIAKAHNATPYERTCKRCQMRFSTLESLKLHVQTYHQELNAVCKICHVRFSGAEALDAHMTQAHRHTLIDPRDARPAFLYFVACKEAVRLSTVLGGCFYCKWPVAGNIDDHILGHMKMRKDVYTVFCEEPVRLCDLDMRITPFELPVTLLPRLGPCGPAELTAGYVWRVLTAANATPKEQEQEQVQAGDDRPPVAAFIQSVNKNTYACTSCDKVIGTYATTALHVFKEHLDGTITCTRCTYKTQNTDELREHMLERHKSFQHCCRACLQEYTNYSLYIRHNCQGHMTPKYASKHRDFACPHCPKSYTTNALLRDHMAAKHGTTKYVCDRCDMRTPYYGLYLKHRAACV